MDIDVFTNQLHTMRERVRRLNLSISASPDREVALMTAMEELETAIEELQVAEEEIRQQNDQLTDALAAADIERKQFQDLFEFAPEPYFVTAIDGTFRRANQLAALLFNTTPRLLVGRPLAAFVPEGQRRAFRAELNQIVGQARIENWVLRIQPRDSAPQELAMTITRVLDQGHRPIALRWIAHSLSVLR